MTDGKDTSPSGAAPLSLSQSDGWSEALHEMEARNEADSAAILTLSSQSARAHDRTGQVREGMKGGATRMRDLAKDARDAYRVQSLRHGLIWGISPVLNLLEWGVLLLKAAIAATVIAGLVGGGIFVLLKVLGAIVEALK